jgi:alpha-mannosidase
MLTTIKMAEDSGAWIFQWYDAKGENAQAVLTLPQTPKKVVATNFLEEDGAVLGFDGKTVPVQTRKNAVTTIKVYF